MHIVRENVVNYLEIKYLFYLLFARFTALSRINLKDYIFI
jgi:hypothetical protein